MKKTIIALAVIALVAPLAFGQEVLSRNAVGYVKVTAPKGFALVSMDFENMGGDTAADIIGDQLPQGSSIFFWDPVGQTYVGETKTKTGWAGTNKITLGRAMFFSVPNTAASNEYQVYLMGEVPATTGQTYKTVGFYFQGYPYPVAQTWTNTDIAKQTAQGDSIFWWDVSGQTYAGATKTKTGWGGAATNKVLNPGEGFIISAIAALTVNETKPYTWPAE